SKMLVATFHQERLFSKNNTARLEIFPPGQHMIDEIFVTFTYIERLRERRRGLRRPEGYHSPIHAVFTVFFVHDSSV
ncbi:hypothetical protein GG344DRAFT_60178, partial [Lentinula edodes]